MTTRLHVGTSGWNYDHWRERFYPSDLPESDWFDHYCQTFDTVEINNTFYHQPSDTTFDHWKQQAPAGFRYAVKANRYLTHLKHLKDPEEPLERFLHGARRLGKHLGPILYQLPPHWNPNLERLEAFLKALPSRLAHVVEFRNRDWLCDETYALLSEYNVALCVHDLLRRHPRRTTGPVVYLRLHGAGKQYGGRYRNRALRSWGEWLQDATQDRDGYVFFNNDEGAHAVRDAQRLRQFLSL